YVHKISHPEHLGEIVHVLDADHRHGRGANDCVAAIQAYALIAITAYGARATRAISKVLRQALGIGPDLTHFATHSQHVAPSYRPPLLNAQAAAIKRFLFVQCHAGTHAEIDQIAFAWIVFFV